MQEQRTFIEDLKYRYTYGGMTIRLIFANTVVYLIILVLSAIANLAQGEFGTMVQLFMKGLFSHHAGLLDFLMHPWGIFTSIFAHFELWHFLFNMIFLYFSGRIFEQLFDQKRLFYTYLLGGVLGNIFETLAAFIPSISSHSVVGASGGIMAIIAAIAFYRPNMKVNLFGIFPIRFIFIGAFFLVKDLINLGTDDQTAHFAHLGGAVLGIISVQQIGSSANIVNRAQRLGDRILRFFDKNRRRKTKMKPTYSNTRMKTDEEYNLDAKSRQEQTDRILDKISKSGYDSLTKKEKDFLFKQSKNG